MAIMKVINENYDKEGDISRLANYILNEEGEQTRYYGGRCLICTGMNNFCDEIEAQFAIIKKNANKEYLAKGALHIVASFSRWYEPQITATAAKNIAEKFLILGLSEYQAIYGVNEKADNIHFHMMVNSIELINGNVLLDKRAVYQVMCRDLCYSSKDYNVNYELSYGRNS